MIVFNLIFLCLYINFVNSLVVLSSIDLVTVEKNSAMIRKNAAWHKNNLDNNVVPALLDPQVRLRLCSLTLENSVFNLNLPDNPKISVTCTDYVFTVTIENIQVHVTIVLCPCPRPVDINDDYFMVKGPTKNSILLYEFTEGDYFLKGYVYNIDEIDLFPTPPTSIDSSTSNHNK